MRRRLGLVIALAALVAPWVLPSSTTAAPGRAYVSVWQPAWFTNTTNMGLVGGLDGLVTDISPFFFNARVDGSIAYQDPVTGPSRLAGLITSARARQIPVLPTVVDAAGKLGMQAILLDPDRRAAHIAAIVSTVATTGADGIDLDYENFAFTDGSSSWATTRPVWVQFISELSAALHADNKLLSVTIPPRWGVSWDYKVYAPEEIHPYVDMLKLMVYDWSTSSPGPIAPMSWVNQVIAYNTTTLGIPPSKLQLGVPAYGRYWRTKLNGGETCPPGSVGRADMTMRQYEASFAPSAPVAAVRDASGELHLRWDEVRSEFTTVGQPSAPPAATPGHPSVLQADPVGLRTAVRMQVLTCTVRHDVYIPDATAIRERADAALAAGWRGIVLWASGYEGAGVAAALRG